MLTLIARRPVVPNTPMVFEPVPTYTSSPSGDTPSKRDAVLGKLPPSSTAKVTGSMMRKPSVHALATIRPSGITTMSRRLVAQLVPVIGTLAISASVKASNTSTAVVKFGLAPSRLNA